MLTLFSLSLSLARVTQSYYMRYLFNLKISKKKESANPGLLVPPLEFDAVRKCSRAKEIADISQRSAKQANVQAHTYSNSMCSRGDGFNHVEQAHVNAGRFRRQRNFLARLNPVSRINRTAWDGVHACVRCTTTIVRPNLVSKKKIGPDSVGSSTLALVIPTRRGDGKKNFFDEIKIDRECKKELCQEGS